MGTRRGNGEGSFRLRPDGRWEGCIRYTDAKGKARRLHAYGKTRKLAKDALDQKMARIREGHAPVDSKSPLADVARRWRTTTLVAGNCRQATKDLYATRCRLYVETGMLADISMALLTSGDVEEWIIASRQNGVAPSSLRTDYTVLRAILDTAVRDGAVAKNVAAQVARPSVPRHEALHLTPTQVSELLEKVSTSRHATPITLAAATGMRRGEVLGLRWRDVNLTAGSVTVSGTMTGSGTKLRRELSAKTDASHRTLPLGDDLINLLRQRQVEQDKDRRLARNLWEEVGIDYVFTTEFGKPVDPRNMLRTLQNAAEALGLPEGTSLHTLRHSAATTLLAGGTHLKLVSAILGHSDTSTTANTYGHAPDAAQRAALDALHAQIAGKPCLIASTWR
ncbi:MAG: tyrosine-type recombinase/integrase [Mycobacterium sp.]